MAIDNLDSIIKVGKSKLRFYILIGSILPIVLISTVLSFIYLNNLEELYANNISELKKTVLEERKNFIYNVIHRTILEIEQIRESVAKENKLKQLTQKELDNISKIKIINYIKNLRLNKKNYIWINRIIDYNGGDNYAIREVHPNLPHTQGMFLSTNTRDINNNKPYLTELEGVKKYGELYFDYFFKKLDSDKIAQKLSFVKLYKPFDWVVGTGIYLDDLESFILLKKSEMQKEYDKEKNISIVISLLVILFSICIVFYIQYSIKRLISLYESKIDNYTKELKLLASTDRLTGLFNRLELDNIYKNELSKSMRYNKEFSIIIMDIDYFKPINDTYGHQVGDSVLKELSSLLQSSIRSVDTLGRWGGEEFLIICYETNLVGALKLAENLRQIIESNDFDIVGKMTSSFGVSTYHRNDTQETMLERADKALYLAKERGRNTVLGELVLEN